jgi:signal transduction histidine kinase
MAEEASRLKDEFLATLSHEIRTPLNAVIGWTRILQTQPSVRSRTHAREVIERNAMSQMRLVEDLLDMARIISGKLRLKIDGVSLDDVARAAIDVVAPGAAAKQIAIEAVFAPELPFVSGDTERLQQVIWNLLERASSSPSRRQVRLEVAKTARMRLSVRDNGQRRRRTLPYVSIGSARLTRRRAGATAARARPVAGAADHRTARRPRRPRAAA